LRRIAFLALLERNDARRQLTRGIDAAMTLGV
jgi:hypothetical protein